MSANGKPTNVRQFIQQAVHEDATLDGIRQLIADVFATEQARKVSCPDCGTEFRAPLPDVKAQLASLVELVEQTEGRAAGAPTPELQIVIERFPRD